MPLADGSHVNIAGESYWLDEDYEEQLGRRCYVHGGRSIFAEQFSPTGKPGAQNLRNTDLKWHITDFSGEGQFVLDNDDPDSATRFFRSEGLDFRIPGQISLNRSIVNQIPAVSGASATTLQGAANFTDVVGTSTTSGTDRRLNVVLDAVETSNHAPGASKIQVDFYLYAETFADHATTLEGSTFTQRTGNGAVTGTDYRLRDGQIWSAKRITGTHFTAGVLQRVLFTVSAADPHANYSVLDVTNPDRIDVVAGVEGNPSSTTFTLSFTPRADREYRFAVRRPDNRAGVTSVVLDSVQYGAAPGENAATIQIWNQTGGVAVEFRDVVVSATAADTLVASMTFTAAAATNYRYQVLRLRGQQRIWVDKVVATLQSSTAYTFDCIDFGLGRNIWLAGHAAGVDTKIWTYDFANDDWDEKSVLNAVASTNETVRAMAHTDSLEYFLTSGNKVYTVNSSGTDAVYASFTADARTLVGMCVAQNRLFVLAEDTSGCRVFSLPLDAGVTHELDDGTGITATVQFVDIDAGAKTPDTTLRQRMVGTSSGARLFVNYGDVTTKLFNVDSSGSVLNVTELSALDTAMRVTAISSAANVTYIPAQYRRAGSSTEGQGVLWAIEANGISERLGFFRFLSDTTGGDGLHRAVVSVVPYQTDVYMLQDLFVWRYSAGLTGGLFLEYELTPNETANARAMAVAEDRIFVCYDTEIAIIGTEDTYRQAGANTSYNEASAMKTSVYDYGLPGVRKVLTKVQVLTTDLDSEEAQVRIDFIADQNSVTWSNLGITGSGSIHEFTPSETIGFTSIQLKVTLESLTGEFTPFVHGIVVTASAADREEYFDLVLLAGDQTSSEHIAGQQTRGSSKTEALVSAFHTGSPTTLVDGYKARDPREARSYPVIVEDFRVEQTKEAEGRVACTLRVI
jgi:hypothetical protein